MIYHLVKMFIWKRGCIFGGMNKGLRHQLKIKKYKRRLKRVGLYSEQKVANPKGIENGVHYNLSGYRSHSNPCSCSMCSFKKYKRSAVKREEQKSIQQDLHFWQTEFGEEDPMGYWQMKEYAHEYEFDDLFYEENLIEILGFEVA